MQELCNFKLNYGTFRLGLVTSIKGFRGNRDPVEMSEALYRRGDMIWPISFI